MVRGYMKLFHGLAPIVGEKLLGPTGFPAPVALAYSPGILEFAGGALLAVGLWTRPIALMLAIEMAVVPFVVHFRHGLFFTSPGGGYKYSGSGRCSIDRAIRKEF